MNYIIEKMMKIKIKTKTIEEMKILFVSLAIVLIIEILILNILSNNLN